MFLTNKAVLSSKTKLLLKWLSVAWRTGNSKWSNVCIALADSGRRNKDGEIVMLECICYDSRRPIKVLCTIVGPGGHPLHQGHWESSVEGNQYHKKFSGESPVSASANSRRGGSLINNRNVRPSVVEVRWQCVLTRSQRPQLSVILERKLRELDL